MSFPRYPKYKNSGVEWLGEVPKSWQVGIIRRFAQMKTGHTPSRNVPAYWENCTIPWFGLADVWQLRDGTRRYLGDTAEMISELGLANSAAELLPAGTVVFSRTASVGFSGIMPKPMATTQDFWNWIPRPGLCSGYLLLLFRAMQGEFRRLTMGSTHKTIYQPDAAALRICVPSVDEQRAIIEFVDAETTKIDALVGEQRRLIALLKEKRQAVISHAVTKGLNPSAPMKPSGIEWLGDVPAHWRVAPLYTRYDAALGKMLDEKRKTGKFSMPYLRNADVQWDWINTTDLPELDIEPDEVDRYTVRPGDVLICEGGAGVGQTAIWQGVIDRCAFQKALHRVRPRSANMNPRFLYYFMRIVVDTGAVLSEGNTSTIPHLTGDKLRALRLPSPPYEEENCIVAFLDAETTKIDALVAEAERAIALLQERRAALISAAVTGKIDVRGAVS